MEETSEEATGWRGSREGWLEAARQALIDGGIGAVKIQPLAAGLSLSRTSFYWFFKDRAALLDALLDDWEATNTEVLVKATEAYADSICEAVLMLIAEFLDGGGFEARFDFAVRGWAHESPDAAARVARADERRLAAIRAMFERFGFEPQDADVRARTIYLVQIGYISMQVREDMETRLARVPGYVMTFTGQAAAGRDLARFMAKIEGRGPV
ncbi:TetR/AcrR family transcriptional regulator [Maritimibacter sp. DP1N21-5]|uniref:TetR/AcrR family transcriptional regulator n=1 Tax=Maritimibacter sp. DP1N21-5 TaxID=2836867 RepID=UPI001C45413A|nr:TetR/AcrR family transcriptional regulator [Maritimibacter sp. DP1N21-5]MBV7410370.1 TetR/AcrR family transcriptional regulator [Maritimibacter sp. DP1N21-5]